MMRLLIAFALVAAFVTIVVGLFLGILCVFAILMFYFFN